MAAALYAFPWTLAVAIAGGFPLYVVLDVAALAVVAWRLWSPLTVFGAACVSVAGAVAFFLITVAGGACGGSTALAWSGGVALALPLGTWGARRGAWVFAAVPAGWILAALWFVLVDRGGGGCFE